jgi:hypothetical protein
LSRFILYGTSACHLCEVAEQMLTADGGIGGQNQLEKVDISDSDALFERYGVRIPVLCHPDGRELGWPFDQEALANFLRS